AGKPLKEVLLTPEEFEHCLALAYTREPSAAETIVEDIGESVDLAKLTEQLPEVADLLEAENDAPIIRLINALLTQAVREGASDVHLQLFESRALVCFPVAGAARRARAGCRASRARVRAAPRPACGDGLAHQGHGLARHRREAPAAGRAHRAASRGPPPRRARLHPSHRAPRGSG